MNEDLIILLTRIVIAKRYDNYSLIIKQGYILICLLKWKYFSVDQAWEVDTKRITSREEDIEELLKVLSKMAGE